MSKELEIILVTTDTTKLQEKMDEAKYVYDIEAILLEKVGFFDIYEIFMYERVWYGD